MEEAPRSPAQETRSCCRTGARVGVRSAKTTAGRDTKVRNSGHLGGKSQKTEQEKDHDLGQAGNAVEKMYQRAFVRDAAVAEEDPRQVGGEIAVSSDRGGERIGQHSGRNDEQDVKSIG